MNPTRQPDSSKTAFALVATLPEDPPADLHGQPAFDQFEGWLDADLARLETLYARLATPASKRSSLGR